jgi:ADP-heptose:LPS heptosyltransferase
MSRSRGSILVIRGGAIGDFVLTLPVLAALRRAFPETHLALLGYPHIASLALAGGLVDELRPIEARGLSSFFCDQGALAGDFADFFADFNVIISYLFDPDAIFQRNVARCSRATFVQGPHRPAEADGLHATEVLLRPLEKLAIFDADPTPRLTLPPAGQPGGNPTPPVPARRRLAVHPGSGSERKNWPEAHWHELLTRAKTRPDLDLLLIGGEAETQRLERLAPLWPADRLELACCLPLPDLAVRLARADAFIGHDSGITHLAAALGLRGLVLWGGTSAAVWRPRSERLRLLLAPDGLAALAPGEVHAALRDLLPGHENP